MGLKANKNYSATEIAKDLEAVLGAKPTVEIKPVQGGTNATLKINGTQIAGSFSAVAGKLKWAADLQGKIKKEIAGGNTLDWTGC